MYVIIMRMRNMSYIFPHHSNSSFSSVEMQSMEELWIIVLKNGAPQIHFYLLPAIKQRNGHTVSELKQQDNNIHTDGSICGCNHKSSSFLLQHDRAGWSNL